MWLLVNSKAADSGVTAKWKASYCSAAVNTRESLITVDPEIMSGKPVFKGTRVSVQTLIEHLESGCSIDYFLDGFPSVSREQALAAAELFTPDDYAYLEYGVTTEE